MMTLRKDTAIIDVLKSAWVPFVDNLGITVGAPAALCFIPFLLVGIPASIAAFVIAGAGAMQKGHAAMFALVPVVLIAMVAFAVVYNAIRVGWTKMLLKLAEGQRPQFSEIFHAKEWFWNFLLVNFIIGVSTAIGSMFLVVPGLYIAVRASLAPFFVVDRNMGPIEAIRASHEMVTGYAWQIALFYLMLFGANMLAGFIPLVGMVLPVAVLGYFDLALAMVYIMRRDGQSAGTQLIS